MIDQPFSEYGNDDDTNLPSNNSLDADDSSISVRLGEKFHLCARPTSSAIGGLQCSLRFWSAVHPALGFLLQEITGALKCYKG